jgi:hypothetical protein
VTSRSRRLHRVGVEPERPRLSTLDSREPQPHQPDCEAGEREDQEDREEPGHGMCHPEAEVLDRRQQEHAHGFAPWARIRKLSEDECHCGVDQEEVEPGDQRRDDMTLKVEHTRCAQHAERGYPGLRDAPLRGVDQLTRDEPVSADEAEQKKPVRRIATHAATAARSVRVACALLPPPVAPAEASRRFARPRHRAVSPESSSTSSVVSARTPRDPT